MKVNRDLGFRREVSGLRCILLGLMLMMASGMYAQNIVDSIDSNDNYIPVDNLDLVVEVAYGSAPVVDMRRSHKLLDVKPYVAGGASTLLLNYEKVVPGASNVLTSPGSLWRTGVDVKFHLNRFMGLATGLAYELAFNQYAMAIVDNNTGSINTIYVSNRFNQMYVPVYLSWHLRMSPRLVINIDTGWYFTFGLSGRMNINGYSTGINSLGQPVITPLRYSTDYFNAERSLINGIKDRDNGMRVALGLTLFRHFSINAVLNVGVRNLAINHDVINARYRNINFAGEFGYIF